MTRSKNQGMSKEDLIRQQVWNELAQTNEFEQWKKDLTKQQFGAVRFNQLLERENENR